MKFKKFLLAVASFLLVFVLAACDNSIKLNYIDSNGKKVEFTLSEKADKKTLTHVLNYVQSVDYKNTSFEVDGDFDIVNKYAPENRFEIKGNGNLKKNNYYLKGNSSFSVAHYSQGDHQDSIYDSQGDVFVDFAERTAYLHAKLDQKHIYNKVVLNSLELPKFDIDSKYIKGASLSNISWKTFNVTLVLDANEVFKDIKAPYINLKPVSVNVVIETKTARILEVSINHTFAYPSYEGSDFITTVSVKGKLKFNYKNNVVIEPLTSEEKALYN